MADSARVTLTGFIELLSNVDAMRPTALAEEAFEIVDHTVEITASSLIQAYPPQSKLRQGVRKHVKRTSTGVVGTVKNTAPHSHLWEFGTEVRSTRQGWHRGTMPSQYNQGLVGIALRNRREMRPQLTKLLTDKGLVVTDDGG